MNDYMHVIVEVVSMILTVGFAYARLTERLARLETKMDMLWERRHESRRPS